MVAALRGLVAPVDDAEPGLAADTIDQIRRWARSILGIEHVPSVWRVLARQPHFLAATWAKNCLVLAAGQVDEATKACTAAHRRDPRPVVVRWSTVAFASRLSAYER